MIEKMLKAAIVCRKEDQVFTLKELRKFGVIHVEIAQKPTDTEVSSSLLKELEKVNRSIITLSETRCKEVAHTFRSDDPKTLTERLVTAVSENVSYKKDIESLHKEREKLLPWGEFSFDSIDKIQQSGYFIYLCATPKQFVNNYSDKGTIEIVSKNKTTVYFLIISKNAYKKEELPLAPLPAQKISISKIDTKIAELNSKSNENKCVISSLTKSLASIKEYKTYIEEKLEFAINKETMGVEKDLRYLKGFVPKKCEKMLLEAARKSGWAIHLEEVTDKDNAPTFINPPKIFSLATPIFDFLGISPSYNEWDISGAMLFFFSLFFAMIIGDAGYGTIFLIVTLVAKIIYRRVPKYAKALNLFILLSFLTIVWGILTGSFFGMDASRLPKEMRGIEFFSNPDTYNVHIQYVCFMIAAIHLSLGRVWKAILYWNSKKALGQLGWALVIWGNFFTAIKVVVYQEAPFPTFAFFLYGIGVALILFFYVNWKEITALFELPLSLIGSFIDVLSYIRLFAVGIAAIYIAENFNQMGLQIMHISGWLFIFGLLIIVAGHLLNITLSLMAVLVHGVRLNILEFSNHMELKWGGTPFKPFAEKFSKMKKLSKIQETTKEGVK